MSARAYVGRRVRYVQRVRRVLMAKQERDGTDSVPLKVVASECNVHERTVRRWIAEDLLPAFQAKPGGRYRIKRSDYLRLLREHTTGRKP